MRFEYNNISYSNDHSGSNGSVLKKKEANKQFIDEPFLDALNEWVWKMDLKGIHTYSNAAIYNILGYKVEEVVGFSTQKIWTKVSKESQIESFKKSLSAGTGWKNYPAYFMHKNGSIKILLSSAIPIYDKEGNLCGYRGIDRDITERVMSENFLKSQKEHIKLINQILRHDISNDLSVIDSSIRLFEATGDKKYIKEIKKRLNKSVNLIHGMQKHEAFILDNNDLKVFSVRDVLEGVIQDKKDIDFSISGNSHFLADEIIYSVFENIINNAINHGQADKIDISIRKENFKCTVTIADNGSGIPEKIKDRLFEEGFKYGPTGNTGLGLHIVKKAMEKYKGNVTVEDNNPHGTKFKLVFHRLGKT
jgi:PAS domain S-box-containing protein